MRQSANAAGPPLDASAHSVGAVGENPFASRYVRPGALPFLFSDLSDVPEVVDRLPSCGWFGSIVGPHGSGKSTLLAHLANTLRQRGHEVRLVVADRSHALRLSSPIAGRRTGRAMLLWDGFDLIPFWKRWWIRRRCRRAGFGLIVTTHRPVGLPVLQVTSTDVSLASRLASMLAGPEFAARSKGLIGQSFRRHRGNLREIWFDLYDRYEQYGHSGLGRPDPSTTD